MKRRKFLAGAIAAAFAPSAALSAEAATTLRLPELEKLAVYLKEVKLKQATEYVETKQTYVVLHSEMYYDLVNNGYSSEDLVKMVEPHQVVVMDRIA